MTLIEKVVEQIKQDLADNDTTAIEELLNYLPDEILRSYLPVA